MFVCCEC